MSNQQDKRAIAWIDADEGRPKPGEYVLAYTEDRDIRVLMFGRYADSTGVSCWWTSEEGYDYPDDYVTHWASVQPPGIATTPPQHKLRIYISGPISGRPIEEARAHFASVQARLEGEGYEVLNPFDNGLDEDATWAEHMREDIAMLLKTDEIYMLSGWAGSRGACLEYKIARTLGIPMRFETLDRIATTTK